MSSRLNKLVSTLRRLLSSEHEEKPPVREQTYLPLPDLARGNWRLKLLREYLEENGYKGLPSDPREMAGYREWIERKGYKPNSVADALGPVRKVYSDHMIYATSVLGGPSRNRDRLIPPASDEEVRRVLTYADRRTPKERAIIYLKVYLGLRDTEISRLNVGDLYERDGEYWLRILGGREDGKENVLRIQNTLLDAILPFQTHLKLKGFGSDHPMFFGQRGRIHATNVSQTVRRIMRESGVQRDDNHDRIKPHSLRNAVFKTWRNPPSSSCKLEEMDFGSYFADLEQEKK